MFVICFVYVVKRLQHLIKMDMALYKSYVLLLLLLFSSLKNELVFLTLEMNYLARKKKGLI